MFGKKGIKDITKKGSKNGNISITTISPCERSIKIHVGIDKIAPIRNSIMEAIRKKATLPGFRKGKAPAELVEQHHAKSIQEETLDQTIKQTLNDSVKENGLRPVGPFEIGDVDFNETEGLTLQAKVEVEPTFKLVPYKGFKLTRAQVSVTLEDIEESLGKLRESMAQLVPVGEGKPKERKLPNLDDEFAKDLGLKDLATLKEHVGDKLKEQRKLASKEALEASLCDELLRRHDFEVPPKLVEHQREQLKQDFKARLMLSGISEEQQESELSKFTDKLRITARHKVKLMFIIDKISEAESIDVKESEVVEHLWNLANRWKKDPLEVRKILDEKKLWPSVLSAIKRGKTMAVLLDSADITESTSTGALSRAK